MTDTCSATDAEVIADTSRWLERAVIGLNLCPFAKSVAVKGQIHFAVTRSVGFKDLLGDLEQELDGLLALDHTVRDTTLFIAPDALDEFLVFNDFLAQANRLLARRELEGVFQIASLHPRYQFADATADAITNCTNRSPYPTLHLLREASVDRAVKAFPHASAIFEINMRTMEQLGAAGWEALGVGARVDRGKLTA